MEDLLLRTCCACLEELTEIRRELRVVNDRVCALDEHVTNLDGTVPQRPRRPEDIPSAEHEAGGLRQLCAVQDRVLHEIFMEACEDGQLCMELRVLAERAYSSFPGGKCASASGWLQGALLSELRRGNLRAVAFQAKPNGGSWAGVGKVSRVCHINDVEAALIKQLQSPDESEDIAVIFYPIFGQSCWQLLEAVLCWCRRERLTARMELAHGTMRNFLSEGNGLRDIDLLVLIRSPSLQTRATVHLEERGDVVLQSTLAVHPAASDAPLPYYRQDIHQDMSPQAKSSSRGDAELLHAAEKAAACHIAELQVLGGAGVPSFDIVTLVTLLRTHPFAQAADFPSLLRTAPAGAVIWAYEARRVELAGAGHIEAQAIANNPNSHADMQSEAFTEVGQALPVLEHSPFPVAATPSALLQASLLAEHNVRISEAQAVETRPTLNAAAATTAIAVGVHGEQAESNSGSSAIEDDSQVPADDGWPPSTVEIQAAFAKCFNDELVGQRQLLLSQLNNLFKMRSGEELNYKASGYEKLRDFLMDIPGLVLLGRGNRMQVRLGDPAAFEAFQERLGRLAEAKTSQLQFRMPKPLPESLQQRLLELFLNTEGHEILLKNFLNTWNHRYPTEQLAYRSLGFRDVRGLLCNVPFLEKVGSKTDARYVLRFSDEIQFLLNKTLQAKNHGVQANGVQNTCQSIINALATQTSPSRTTPAPMEPLSIDYFSGSGAVTAPATPMGRGFAANPMLMRPRYDLQNLSAGRGDSQGHGQVQRMPTASSTKPAHSSTPLAAGPVFVSSSLASSGIGVGRDLDIAGIEPPIAEGMSMISGISLHSSGPSSSGLGGKSTPPFFPGSLLASSVTKAQGSVQPNHSSTTLVPPPPPHWPDTPSMERGVPAAVPLTDGLTAHQSNKVLVNGRWVPNGRQAAEESSSIRGAIRNFGGAATGFGQGGLPGVSSFSGIHGLSSSPGLDTSDLELSDGLVVPATVAEDRREDDSGHTESEGITMSGANDGNLNSTDHRIGKVVHKKSGRRLERKNKNASFFVSSPGAFSSETRDASIHQGKFDMSTVLQTQLTLGSPCLVCDISGGQVMVTNTECEDLFESVDLKRQLVQSDIFSLIHQEDRDKFSTFFAYLMISERTKMDPIEIRIVTMLGHTRKVRAEGAQLIGVWWQLDFFLLESDRSEDHVGSS